MHNNDKLLVGEAKLEYIIFEFLYKRRHGIHWLRNSINQVTTRFEFIKSHGPSTVVLF